MTPTELKEKYRSLALTGQLCRGVSNPGAKVNLKGVVGAAKALLAASVFESVRKTLLVLVPDRERAIYFYNDMQVLGLEKETLFFPRSARVAYEIEQTDNANVAMRAEVLHLLKERDFPSIVVSHPEAIAEKVITKQQLKSVTFEIETGNQLDFDFVDEWMHTYGFTKEDYVFEPGQYAIRGGILDIFSYSFDHPYRIEMSGSTVESIRKFEAGTQLSVAHMTRATIVPDVTRRESETSRVTLPEFLGNDVIVWLDGTALVLKHAEAELERARHQYTKAEGGLLKRDAPEILFAGEHELRNFLENVRVVESGGGGQFPTAIDVAWHMEPQPSFNKNFDMLGINLANHHKQGFLNVVAAGQPKQIERLYQIFQDKDHVVNFDPLAIELSEGFIDKENKVLVYTDHQLFERYHRFRLKEGFSKSKEAMTL
ncbi:MAG: transcription-repair coupling factor, partial [Flavobacteriales bacterium]|nr:transcription-repair coupling factor [Flavobacteriales bacterium]